MSRAEEQRKYNRSPKGRAAVARARARYRTTAKYFLVEVRHDAKNRGSR